MTVAGALLAVAADGRRALGVVGPLAAAVWSYDLALEDGRRCDGRHVRVPRARRDRRRGGVRRARRAALRHRRGGHTAVVTELSRREVEGAEASLALGALAATAGVAAAAGALSLGASGGRARRAAGARAARGVCGGRRPAQAAAARDPSPARVREAVGAGVLGLIPLEGALVAAASSAAAGAALTALWPLARTLSRRRTVT